MYVDESLLSIISLFFGEVLIFSSKEHVWIFFFSVLLKVCLSVSFFFPTSLFYSCSGRIDPFSHVSNCQKVWKIAIQFDFTLRTGTLNCDRSNSLFCLSFLLQRDDAVDFSFKTALLSHCDVWYRWNLAKWTMKNFLNVKTKNLKSSNHIFKSLKRCVRVCLSLSLSHSFIFLF